MTAAASTTTPATPSPYPAATRQATALISSTPTTATRISFTDKLLITITQNGRLAHWVHVPLDTSTSPTAPHSASASYDDEDEDAAPSSDLLPTPHLTATTILGGGDSERDIVAQTLATAIASAVKERDAEEGRLLVLGLGLERREVRAEEFGEVLGLVLGVL